MAHRVRNKFKSEYYLTFNNARAKGLKVKKGSKGCPLLWFGRKKYEDATGEEKEYTIVQVYYVFNCDQIYGLEGYAPETKQHVQTGTPNERCEQIWDWYTDCPDRTYGGQPCYIPISDTIAMPNFSEFKTAEGYYATLFHEMIHSTGAKKRLDRKFGRSKGTTEYAFEELVAEIGAAYLCQKAGILNEDMQNNSAAYLKGWIAKMESDNKYFFKAAGLAKKAKEWIEGEKKEHNEKTTEAQHDNRTTTEELKATV